MKVVYDERHRLHNPERELENSAFQPPFENPRRADIIAAALAADDAFDFVDPVAHGTDPISGVHDPGLVRFLATAWDEYQVSRGPTHDVIPDVFTTRALTDAMFAPTEPVDVGMRLGWWCYETTTPLTEGTYMAARAAVDVALSAGDRVLEGERAVYGLCRPPGHHAPRAAYGGYCFFNNAAIVAHDVASRAGVRVAVLDVDYHHGNGTQQIFYERDDVKFVSLHGHPDWAYPYLTGRRDETGSGRGRGANANYPLERNSDDDAVISALGDAGEWLGDAEFLVVSLGLDMFVDDPISELSVTTEGFARMGALIGSFGLPTVVLQEGGYAADALGANAVAFLRGLDVR